MWTLWTRTAFDWRVADEPWAAQAPAATTDWTDHQTHDPGVTLLEALSFSLTDFDL